MNESLHDYHNLTYLLPVVASMLPLDELRGLSFYPRDDGQLLVEVWLVGGETVGGYAYFNDDGTASAVQSVFDGIQDGLTETAAFWGQAIPPCRTGHVHPAAGRVDGPRFELCCPADDLPLRTLVELDQSPV